jgi:hypothetical protein
MTRHIYNTQGTGFHTRDHNQQDVEEEIDIDGDDRLVDMFYILIL